MSAIGRKLPFNFGSPGLFEWLVSVRADIRPGTMPAYRPETDIEPESV